ncbi:MAG: cytidylate kinase-like family protein [Lachnospiraceae bacterium]
MENRVITIERKFGANGHALAKKFAEEMGIPLYDEELVDLAMEKSGLDHDKIEKASEKQPSRFIFRTSDMGREPIANTMLLQMNDLVFRIQAKIIHELAQKEDCVIVGRCADYILEDIPTCRSVYVSAPFEYRVEQIMEHFSLSKKEAEKFTNRMDKQRSYYYSYYTNKKWGSFQSYNLMLDSSAFDIDSMVGILKSVYQGIH